MWNGNSTNRIIKANQASTKHEADTGFDQLITMMTCYLSYFENLPAAACNCYSTQVAKQVATSLLQHKPSIIN